MIKLNIEQQVDELKDVEDFIKDLHPMALVELQTQQVRRLLYFARKGVNSYKNYRAKTNPVYRQEIDMTETDNTL